MPSVSQKHIDNHPILHRFSAPGPKRILALDGGGIRGALCIGILEKIEVDLAQRYNNPDFRLSDYYDIIGGTSTGAIIATCLAKGMKVSEVKELYLNMGKNIFFTLKNYLPKFLRWIWWVVDILLILLASARFSARRLEKVLQEHFPHQTFGSDEFKTGLCIVTKRVDTLSPWVMHNHPQGKYYDMNKGILIKDLLRATSAAPSYFKPKVLTVGNNEQGLFIDGGVSSFNNPALILFYICTLSNLPYQWATGKNNLMITSVGTGFRMPRKSVWQLKMRRIFMWAGDIPNMFMADATALNQLILQTMSHTRTPQFINSEFDNLKGVSIVPEPLFTYQRYNVSLHKNTLQDVMKKEYSEKELDNLVEMSHGYNAPKLYEIGQKFSQSLVKNGHFPPEFDLLYRHDKNIVLTQAQAQNITTWLRQNGDLYAKFRPIYARKAQEPETIISITSSGEETTNTADLGDYIVKNQTTAREEYVVKKEKFDQLYTYAQPHDGIWHEYKPKGKVYALHLSEATLQKRGWPTHFYHIPAWNEAQYCTEGDYLACPPDGAEFYRIGRQEFEKTYTLDNTLKA